MVHRKRSYEINEKNEISPPPHQPFFVKFVSFVCQGKSQWAGTLR